MLLGLAKRACTPYVVRSDSDGQLLLNLLLFLSALLTGLTGAISGGQRADAPAVQQSVARAVEVAAEYVAQQPLAARKFIAAARRPILSVLDTKPGWSLAVDAPATDIARICKKLLV